MNLQPGTELDAKVAEIIFGRIPYFMVNGPMIIPKGSIFGIPLPEYSTTWNGMQLVVEEMQRRGWDYIFQSLINWNQGVRFDKRGENGIETVATARSSAQTLPHAVCIAALSALEGQADD